MMQRHSFNKSHIGGWFSAIWENVYGDRSDWLI